MRGSNSVLKQNIERICIGLQKKTKILIFRAVDKAVIGLSPSRTLIVIIIIMFPHASS